MLKFAARLGLALALGMLLALNPPLLASLAQAPCTDNHRAAACQCGSCAPGCSCCLKQSGTPVAPQTPAVPAASLLQDWTATCQLAATLAPASRSDSLTYPTFSVGASPALKVPLYARHCAFLI